MARSIVGASDAAHAAVGSPSLRREGLPQPVVELCQSLSLEGHQAWLVGGCVRDSLLSQLSGEASAGTWRAKDWDIATDALPEQVAAIFRRVIPTGIEHGTVTVILHDMNLEVTTLRTERGYVDGRRPDQIDFVSSIDEDLARRDFTVNAIAFEPRTERLIDPFDGLGDLSRRRLAAVGDASGRFAEDGLRVLRAARFVAALEFELAPETARAIRPSLDTYRRVSPERIREEWNKTLLSRRPSRGFFIMHEHGLLAITAPEVDSLSERPERTASGVSHLTLACHRMDSCPPQPTLRLAALLRDIAATAASSADAADALLSRLRYSNSERKQVTRLILHQELPLGPLTDAELRRWLRRVGPDIYRDLSAIGRAELAARSALAGADLATSLERQLDALSELEQRATSELARRPPLALSDLAIDGRQLMQNAGYRPGREIGVTLEALLALVIEDPRLNTAEQLLEHARALKPQPPRD